MCEKTSFFSPFFGKENIGREKDHFYQTVLVETFNFQALCLARENSVGFDNTDLRPDILMVIQVS